jgi:flagellar hook-length control protein FliK
MVPGGSSARAPFAPPPGNASFAAEARGDDGFSSMLDEAAPAEFPSSEANASKDATGTRDTIAESPASESVPATSPVATPTPTTRVTPPIASDASETSGATNRADSSRAGTAVTDDASAESARGGTAIAGSAWIDASALSPSALAQSRGAWVRASATSGGSARGRNGGTAIAGSSDASTTPAGSASAKSADTSTGGASAAANCASTAPGSMPVLDLATLQAMRGTAGQLQPAQTAAVASTMAADAVASATTNDTAALAEAVAAAAAGDASAKANADRVDGIARDSRAITGPARETTMLVSSGNGSTAEVTRNAAGVETRHTPMTTATAILHVEARVQDARFAQACADRVVWCINQKIQHAEMRLEPPELGPIDVRISIEGDTVHTRFSAAHAVVRDALEQSIPKLRELVEQDGMHLASADVGSGGRHTRDNASSPPSSFVSDDTSTAVPATELRIARRAGLLDEYA